MDALTAMQLCLCLACHHGLHDTLTCKIQCQRQANADNGVGHPPAALQTRDIGESAEQIAGIAIVVDGREADEFERAEVQHEDGKRVLPDDHNDIPQRSASADKVAGLIEHLPTRDGGRQQERRVDVLVIPRIHVAERIEQEQHGETARKDSAVMSRRALTTRQAVHLCHIAQPEKNIHGENRPHTRYLPPRQRDAVADGEKYH